MQIFDGPFWPETDLNWPPGKVRGGPGRSGNDPQHLGKNVKNMFLTFLMTFGYSRGLLGLETCNFGGRFGPDMAHSGPSGPCQSLSFVFLPLTTTYDSSVAHLGSIFGPFVGRRPGPGGSSGSPRNAGKQCYRWSPELSLKSVTMFSSTFEGSSHLERPERRFFQNLHFGRALLGLFGWNFGGPFRARNGLPWIVSCVELLH